MLNMFMFHRVVTPVIHAYFTKREGKRRDVRKERLCLSKSSLNSGRSLKTERVFPKEQVAQAEHHREVPRVLRVLKSIGESQGAFLLSLILSGAARMVARNRAAEELRTRAAFRRIKKGIDSLSIQLYFLWIRKPSLQKFLKLLFSLYFCLTALLYLVLALSNLFTILDPFFKKNILSSYHSYVCVASDRRRLYAPPGAA